MASGRDVYEENKRLKREVEILHETLAQVREDKDRRAATAAAKIEAFAVALAEGRVILEEWVGNVPGWRIAVIPATTEGAGGTNG